MSTRLPPKRLPIVAVIGRPNVGKSTLINRMVGKRQAIVEDFPGVTRDRAYYEASWLTHHFTVIDTGGLAPSTQEEFAAQVNDQVHLAIAEADVILFVVDSQTGPTDADKEIAKLLYQSPKPVMLLVNKIDDRTQMPLIHDFHKLGLGEPIGVSAMHGTAGMGDMLDSLIELIQAQGDHLTTEQQDLETERIRLAFLGRPNVGKSSLVNRLIGEHRSIVSDVSGTTRDAIDTELDWEGHALTLVDTAGIRKKSKVAYGVEMFSVDRSIRAMRQADATILVIDAVEGITDQDKRLIETSNEQGNALVLVVNKWDLIPDKNPKSTQDYRAKLVHDVPHARFAPMVFVSALTGQRIETIFQQAILAVENNRRRIQTSVLNQLILDAATLNPSPPVKNKRFRIYYATQVSVSPPTFLLFVNDDKLLKDTYKRYLENQLRQNIALEGSPIVIACRNREEKAKK